MLALLHLITAILTQEGFACKLFSSTGSYRGLYCGSYNIRNTSRISRQQCTTECIRSPTCYVFSYNNVHKYCLIGDHPCSKVQENSEFEMQMMAVVKVENCVRWTDDQSPYQPRSVQYGTSTRPMAVIRITEGGNVLPGKWKQTTSTAQAGSSQAIHSERWQVLLLAEGCTTSWLPYDPLSEPLPTNVVPGGRLDDGTPLYVAGRLYTTSYVSGYYNPLTQMVHTESSCNVHTSGILDVLIIIWVDV